MKFFSKTLETSSDVSFFYLGSLGSLRRVAINNLPDQGSADVGGIQRDFVLAIWLTVIYEIRTYKSGN